MQKTIVGTLPTKEAADGLISHLSRELGISHDDISYVYRSGDGQTHVDVVDVTGATDTPSEGAATGAVVGGSVGALAGIAAIIGVIPVIGPIFAAGPLLVALGLGTGAAGTVAAGALTGAIAGSVIGLLTNLGAPESVARQYEEKLKSGEVLVAVAREDVTAVESAFRSHGATSVDVFQTTA